MGNVIGNDGPVPVPRSRRLPVLALVVASGLALLGIAVSVAMLCARDRGTAAARRAAGLPSHGPRTVVDRPHRDLGIIDAPDEFAQKFLIHNEGDAPLQLARGPSTCKCTVTDLPETPVPPGGQAEIGVGFTEVTKRDILKTGHLARGMTVLTNDPEHEQIVLEIEATVRRRLAAEPADLSFYLQVSDLPSEEKRWAETLIYSQTWDRFELAVASASLKAMTWHLEPAAKEELAACQARSGYHLRVTLPSDMPDGHFAESLVFTAKPAGATEKPHSLSLQVQGKIEGRLTIDGPKVDVNHVVRLGVLQEGEGARAFLIMKVNDPRPALVFKTIETEPALLRAHVVPYRSNSAGVGLYRIDLEVPRNARPCSFAAGHEGTVRMKTDHPRLPVIELKVDFAVVSGEDQSAHVAGR